MSVREAFAAQGQACDNLGSPFMGRLMPLIGERLSSGSPVADRVLSWPGDTTSNGQNVPLRLAGALHALRIGGLALTEVYPPCDVDDGALWQAVEAALTNHEDRIMRWLDSPPQTNEVRRSAAIASALSVLSGRYELPVELLELGCSAGLNLRFDHFRIAAGETVFGPEDAAVRISPDWTGPSPAPKQLPIIARRGVDLSPIDPAMEAGRLRLLAYLWPDQPDRMAMTDAAIGVAREIPAAISAGDAAEWIERALAEPAPDRLRVVYHTVAWQYFPQATKDRAEAAMRATRSPLARFSMEADGGRGAALTLTQYPNGEREVLGRADFHGRWIDWQG